MPDSTILVDYMLAKVTDLVEHLVVYPDHMRRNLELTGGLVYSQRLLLALIDKGAQRKESYEAVQRNAMASWRGGGALQELAEKDPFIAQHLNRREIATCFNPEYYLRHLDQIYRRVFGRARLSSGAKKKGARS
jgi:adenylosuccinate lyase